MANPVVTFSASNHVGIITLNRPPANSYEIGFLGDLEGAIDEAEKHPEVRVVILKSASEKFFCAGADIKAFAANDAATNIKMIHKGHATLDRMPASSKIFIAALNGHTLGGGLEIALACDLRFAAEGEYKLGLPEVTLGLLPGNGGTQRLPRLIGPARALEMMITGRMVSPAEALELGFVNRLFPADRLISNTEAFARRAATGPGIAISAIKQLVHATGSMGLGDGLALEAELMSSLFNTQDALEGVSAFAEKRKAVFKGR